MVFTTKKAYKENGLAGIKPKPRGRKKGEKRVLSPEQEKEIQKYDKITSMSFYHVQLLLPLCGTTAIRVILDALPTTRFLWGIIVDKKPE